MIAFSIFFNRDSDDQSSISSTPRCSNLLHAFLAVTSPIWVPTWLIYAQLIYCIYSKLHICVVISSCDNMRSFIQFPSCILHVFLVVSTQGLPLPKNALGCVKPRFFRVKRLWSEPVSTVANVCPMVSCPNRCQNQESLGVGSRETSRAESTCIYQMYFWFIQTLTFQQNNSQGRVLSQPAEWVPGILEARCQPPQQQ